MNINSRLYYQTAVKLGFPVTPMDQEIDGFKIELNGKIYYFRGGSTPFNDVASSSIANNKFCMNHVLRQEGFPLPKATAISRKKINEGSWDVGNLSFPMVAKPTMDSEKGTDVLCNIKDMETLRDYLKKNNAHHKFITLEEFEFGLNAYRVLVFYNKVIGVTQRIPTYVIGDGKNSISQLVMLANEKRKAFKDKVSLGEIKIDKEVEIRLEEKEMSLDTVPKEDEKVTLCYGCNGTRGGTRVSLGKEICKENKKLLCRAAKVLNLNLVGFDVLCEDINVPIESSRGFIIEANHNPDITIHENAMSGVRNVVSRKILRKLIYKHPIAYLYLSVKRFWSMPLVRCTSILILLFVLVHWHSVELHFGIRTK